ncbi:MAG: hypothetical protein JJU01_06270 [Alkalibacterium sp.]|nr:hypothetical protein [Alkalibacterium sp.]TVP93484.1 MAG: hypothetical protein EA249_00230 [Alkalibacterium sp.]
MSIYESVKHFLKKLTNESDQLIKTKPLKDQKDGQSLNTQHKISFSASEITNNQAVVDSIVEKVIRKDYSKRIYAGKRDEDIKACKERIYQYESFRTKKVKMVPRDTNELEVYIEDIYLGKLPESYTQEALFYLQSAVVMNFAYISGGPFKHFNADSNTMEKGSEHYDLTVYIQFS